MDWKTGTTKKSTYQEYDPKKDSFYKHLLKKPINKLTPYEVQYVYAISWGYYMADAMQYETVDELIAAVTKGKEEELDSCYKFVHGLSFPLRVYRAIRNNQYKNSELVDGNINISGKNNSTSWTVEPAIYKDNSSLFKNANTIVTCQIEPNVIDNAHTIRNYVHYTARPQYGMYGEYEITLKSNFKQSDLHNLEMLNKDEI